MEIRPIEAGTRSNILVCEDCRTQTPYGIFVKLGFFNGFVCSNCAHDLRIKLVKVLFGAEDKPAPSIVLDAGVLGKWMFTNNQDAPTCTPGTRTTIYKGNPMYDLTSESNPLERQV